MNLESLVKRGPTREPLRVLLHGVEGIGKTTFAASIPDAVFLSPEDGGGDLDFARLTIDSWTQALARLEMLITEEHSFRTVVIDTLDFLERLCWQHLMAEAKVDSIEKVNGGYGKGYVAATDEMTRMVRVLDRLRARRRMNVVGIAHTEVKTFNDPEGPNYDRYQIRMHKGAVGLWSGWSDAVLFANYDIKVKTEKGGGDAAMLKKGKAATTEPDRILFTQPRAAFDAKNRYNLPSEIELSWDAFAKAIRWAERDAAVLGTQSATPVPTAEETRAAVVHALRELDWTQEDVAALLDTVGVKKAVDVPESSRAAIVAALQISKSKSEAA